MRRFAVNVSYYRPPYLSFALGSFDWLNVSLQNPRVMGGDFLVIVLEQADFLEAVSFVEPFSVTI